MNAFVIRDSGQEITERSPVANVGTVNPFRGQIVRRKSVNVLEQLFNQRCGKSNFGFDTRDWIIGARVG